MQSYRLHFTSNQFFFWMLTFRPFPSHLVAHCHLQKIFPSLWRSTGDYCRWPHIRYRLQFTFFLLLVSFPPSPLPFVAHQPSPEDSSLTVKQQSRYCIPPSLDLSAAINVDVEAGSKLDQTWFDKSHKSIKWNMGGEHGLMFPTILTFVLFSLENGLFNYFRVEILWSRI